MSDSTITLRGWLGGDVTVREAGGARVASFRLACTPRRFNRRTETWSEGTTQWYTVSAWRALADSCATSLRRGDPVVVHGRLEHRTYINANGVEVLSLKVDAVTIGHDLSRGTSTFTRTPRAEPPAERSTGPDASPEAAA